MNNTVQPENLDTISIPREPHMDAEGRAYFKQALTEANIYFEYGCGGSTSYAARTAKVPTILSVETDGEWANAVRNDLSDIETTLILEHCDLGPVRKWGFPVSYDQAKNFWLYVTQTWSIAQERNMVPDVILIDGRFRVACFLYSLLCARVGTTILFDDYFDRPYYCEVERYCDITEKAGRMGVFEVTKSFSHRDLTTALMKYSMIWD